MAINTADSKVQTTAAARNPYITSSVTSKDGTTISYRQIGHGPAVVLLGGAMETAQSHMQLAEALADTFTLYMPEAQAALSAFRQPSSCPPFTKPPCTNQQCRSTAPYRLHS